MQALVRAVLVPALVLSLEACHSITAPTAPLDIRVTVPFGQAVTVGDGSLTLRFNGVPEDSRCPGDAICIWPGRAVVNLTLTNGRRSLGFQLRTDPPGDRAVAEGITLELVQLEPYPFASRPHQPSDYRLTVRVVR